MRGNAERHIIPVLLVLLWTVSMVFVYSEHRRRVMAGARGAITSDVTMEEEELRYYGIFRDGVKIGYRTERTIPGKDFLISAEENVIKMNLAGLSREVFFQSVVAIDTTDYRTRQMQFTIRSGSHFSEFTGSVRADTLYIEVQNYVQTPKRTGYFLIDESITLPLGVPFYLSRMHADMMSLMVFDPVIFSEYTLHSERREGGTAVIGQDGRALREYDLAYRNRNGRMWLDTRGRLVKAEGYMLFGGRFGDYTFDESNDRDVFLLPVDATFGNDVLKSLRIRPVGAVDNPREVRYGRFRLEGIRAAYIDVTPSNQVKVSNTPVELAVYDHPVAEGERRAFAVQAAVADTALAGSSDFIQPRDGRIVRMAVRIWSVR